MILFFHFLCFLARYIVLNLSKSISKRKLKSEDGSEDNSVISQSPVSLNTQIGFVKQPIYKDGTLKFFPPVYIQRYETVALILEEFAPKGNVHKVVDFGCGELGFFMYLKNIEGINEILEVDIDEEKLKRYSFKAAPLTSDYLMKKCKNPLDVYLLAGSIADYDDHLIGTDTVIGIEVIEHLTEETLKKMPYNIFHQIKPKLAIFTTPNAEFNSLFPNFTDLRHSDHKFEWTRKEFYTWTQEIINQYPEYIVRFYGIGAGPEGTENLGCCTQMAVFQKLENEDLFVTAREKLEGNQIYKLIMHYKYPVYCDTRSNEEKIIHEIQYQLPYILSLPEYYNYDESESEIPLSLLKDYVADLCNDEEDLRNILQRNGLNTKMKNGSWYVVETGSTYNNFSGSSYEENDSCEEGFVEKEFSKEDIFSESWDCNEEDDLQLDDANNFFSAKSEEQLKSIDTSRAEPNLSDNSKTDRSLIFNEETKSAPHSFKDLFRHLASSDDSCQFYFDENKKIRRKTHVKSKIPQKKYVKNIDRELSSSAALKQETLSSYVCKPNVKIFKSISLDDSCLKEVSRRPFARESFCSNLTPGGHLPFRDAPSCEGADSTPESVSYSQKI